MHYETLDELIDTHFFRPFYKKVPTQILRITAAVVQQYGPRIVDREGRVHEVKVGRSICKGIDGELWTTSNEHVEQLRVAVSGPDAEGFVDYVSKKRAPVLVAWSGEPVSFVTSEGPWESFAACYLTWNGIRGSDADIRIIEKPIFECSYGPWEEDR